MGRKRMIQYFVSINEFKSMSAFYRKHSMSFGETAGLVVIIKDRMLFLNL